MNLRCTFHVPTTTQTQEQRPRMPSVVDIEVDYVEEPMPRGRSPTVTDFTTSPRATSTMSTLSASSALTYSHLPSGLKYSQHR